MYRENANTQSVEENDGGREIERGSQRVKVRDREKVVTKRSKRNGRLK